MPSMQIVFLFDLNAYTDDKGKIVPNLNNHLLCLRVACLKILTHFQACEPNLKWGFKFFDSRGSLSQNMCKYSFSNFSLENFEILENEICVRYQRHVSLLDALSASAQRNDLSISNEDSCLHKDNKKDFYPVQVLHLALTQILCEYQWNNQISLFSPSTRSNRYKLGDRNDILFLISKCPENEEIFHDYFGISYDSIMSTKFKRTLLPTSLSEQLLLKSSILWIWLTTNDANILGNYTDEIIYKMAELFKSLKCTLIPFSTFSKSPCILKFQESRTQTIRMDLFNSIMPFSTVFSQCITHPYYVDMNISSDSIISVQDKEMFVNITRISFQLNSNLGEPGKECHQRNTNKESLSSSNSTSLSKIWSKFTVLFAIPKKTFLPACDTFLCLPSISSQESNYYQFQEFIKILIIKDVNLFITCESNCGAAKTGLFAPLSETSAVISVLDLKEVFKYKRNFADTSFSTPCHSENMNETFSDSERFNVEDSFMKPFQMENLEQWFEPTSSISQTALLCKEQTKNSFPQLKSFYKELAVKLSETTKQLKEKENITPMDEVPENDSSQILESYNDISYDELIKLLRAEYDRAIEPGISVLQSAKKIVKSSYSFFLVNSSDSRSLEDIHKDFMAEFFCMNNQKLNEAFDISQDKDKIIQECQLQVLLAFETEALFPSSDKSNCVNRVTSFLRTMSFCCGASELNKFLHEVLRENYKDTLYDILVEVGDELDIPLFEEDNDLFDEPFEPPSSASTFESNNSLPSALSIKSLSSTSSRTGSRKLIRRRSDITDNSKSRQFLLTKSSPKKKKFKNLCPGAENIPIRYSPRLSSKRKRERHQKGQLHPGHVRRNLFPKDQRLQTPHCNQTPRSRKRRNTPKAHHILKTDFVAETPSSKQNRSALQRRKSFMESDSDLSIKEIAESPKIVKHAPDSTHKEILKKLSGLNSHNFAQPTRPSLPSCSNYSQYTPESKRRLSLKLFSKLLTSPTARRGLKRCSKRLFDPVSPNVENNVAKKAKLEIEDEMSEDSEVSPQQDKKSPEID